MTLRKCAYCGCSEAECLAEVPECGLYFCNGKGVIPQSHITHFLKQTNLSSFTLPPENRFHQVKFECYVCHSTNVFQLGFVRFPHDSSVYITCRQPCQFDAEIQREPTHTFHPLISNGQILPEIVNIPPPDKYKKVSVADALAVIEKVNPAAIMPNIEAGLVLPAAKLTYDSAEDFTGIMRKFVDAERSVSHELEKHRRFGDLHFEWANTKSVSFKARAPLLKLISNGTSVMFTVGDKSEVAKVMEVTRQRTVHCIFSKDSSFYTKDFGITLTVIYGAISFERQLKALDIFEKDKKCCHYIIRDAILGNIKNFKDHNRVKGQNVEMVLPSGNDFPILNESQQKATKTALKQRFTLIQGPPGTGKTTVIAAIVASFVKAGVTPVLVLTQSNIAADFATRRISQTGVNVIRVLAFNKETNPNDDTNYETIPDFDIRPFTSHAKAVERYGEVFEGLCQSSDQNDRTQARNLEKDIIREYPVVCTTCGSAGGSRITSMKFPVVIFDESGQVLDPDIVIGATRGAQQMILVGDHRQLGPVVLSKKAIKSRYDVSLMKRLTALNVRPSVLTMQYRMHPSISSFPSEAFYMKLVKDGLSASDRKWPRPILPWPDKESPVMFWNVDSREENYDSAISYVNVKEAEAISQIVDMMCRNGVKSGDDIGIITPYTGQQMYLMDSLPSLCKYANDDIIQEIEIASVDAFQGREKNFIIFSCVRANDMNDIGFMRDQRRLCVSLTRAKYGLVIVGNAATFARSSIWCKLIQNLMNRGLFVEGELSALKKSSFTALVQEEEGSDDDVAVEEIDYEMVY
ncbi:regulator of nonsense transcripts 1, putative [Trichomonas vaginalis G3]|uniref:Regulator of nonsense transcripts 1, putative n=1 Tax=Trichomonas vaginalis (strain ATCC PRA-98 / G3) TaxID=412133 RepID=A2EAT3_TRIV3|nr:nuclear-transcribed mRNA catabolic process, nonsense-mediated decay [Trichomonas vaginalis G3]EAY10286.1 regulator of nonsense transcripts 1, putative [Trichomonas vaginalis G3]KAI5487768.1 nuclear-transcribed mRNA catabolic process, nonsense-mediated decay [Trichomonas vaginalis G3]|eukprot:XP_001322509.1 regulator of nonsense transcripts 1 [Trichomonas vaginalis G3]